MTAPLLGWSLRRRIVVGSTAVIAAALLTTGIISVATVASSVTAVVDSQVAASISSLAHTVEKMRDKEPTTDGKGFDKPLIEFAGHAPGSIIAIADGGAILDSAMFTEQDAVPCTRTVLDELAAESAEGQGVRTVELDGLGDYRVTFQETAEGEVLIAGASLDIARQAAAGQTLTLSIVAALAIAVTIAGIMLVTRLALRPLNRMADAASAVASLPLDKGDIAIAEAIDRFETTPGTEVGRVGDSFNRMIDHIDHALAVRQQTDQRMRRFVTDASHELRTPLAAILGYAELTRQENAELPDLTEYSLARIESEANRMRSLVDDLLLLARLDEGQDLRLDDVDFGEIVVNAVSDARAAAPGHEWSVSVPDHPVMVHGDHERLHQVVANLLSNAREHTPEGTRVSARVAESAGSVVLTVTDTGPGIEESLLPKLFDRFTRGDESRSRTAGSTGLGLAIVTSIVESHDGSVTVGSTPSGATFTVTLPTP